MCCVQPTTAQVGFAIHGSANVGTANGSRRGVGAFGSVDMVMVPRNPRDTSSTAASKVLRGPLQALLEVGINSPHLDAYNFIAVGACTAQGSQWEGRQHVRHLWQQVMASSIELGHLRHRHPVCSDVCHAAAVAPLVVSCCSSPSCHCHDLFTPPHQGLPRMLLLAMTGQS
jgi:hypothetical protein